MPEASPLLPMHTPWRVEPADPERAEVQQLLAELSQVLLGLTGDAGTSSFNADDLSQPRAALLVARDAAGQACACGVLRPLEGDASHRCGEIKRMYARASSRGAGSAVLAALEQQAPQVEQPAHEGGQAVAQCSKQALIPGGLIDSRR